MNPPPSPLTPAQSTAIQQTIDASLRPINDRLDRGAERMTAQAEVIEAMRQELARNTATTNEVRELLDVGKSGLKVLGWLGAAARWVGYIGTAVAGLSAAYYVITHGGSLPPKP